ncbi:hypothetical protein EYF80_003164 [Liparis tanakae]|uniref:Uncharacterized protein n=1 Tax=Liparis tanakae TaxID=230148 RepID=A0A4Z2J900_9TELE|nr:hypothetical protein EYF80_003164 [Liparis tanakae]
MYNRSSICDRNGTIEACTSTFPESTREVSGQPPCQHSANNHLFPTLTVLGLILGLSRVINPADDFIR